MCYLIEWFLIRPTEIFLAAALGLDSAVEELRFKLFPSVHQPFTSSTLSDGLKRDTKRYVGSPIGITKYRDIQSNFSTHHPDPLPPSKGRNTADLQQGHTASMANQWYNRTQEVPHGFTPAILKDFQRASRWWQHITGKSFIGVSLVPASHAVSQGLMSSTSPSCPQRHRLLPRWPVSCPTRAPSTERYCRSWRTSRTPFGRPSPTQSPRVSPHKRE